MEKVLQVIDLSKTYGNKQALDGVSFSIKEGSCFGLLGPNGAGKSTTMKILTGIIPWDSGFATIFGLDIKTKQKEIHKQVGYVPQGIALYEKLSAYQNLIFFGEMYGLRGNLLKQRIMEVLEHVGLSERAKDPIHTFSGGMKRRVNIAVALLHQPRLIILDEPTVGIDPHSRNHIFEMIRALQREGVTILYSTHYMEEVETLCDEIAIIDHGKVITQGPLEQLLVQYGNNAIYLEAEGIIEPPLSQSAKRVTSDGKGWVLESDQPLETLKELTEICLDQQVNVKKLEILRPSLETVFLGLTGASLRD